MQSPRLPLLLGSAVTIVALASGCAARAPALSPDRQSTSSILTKSSPAAGSTVREPVDELKLQFDPPARLDEVIVSGPNGLMPMMVHAVGESADYTLPLSGLGPGAYTVNWRASARGTEYRGSFRFTAK